MVLLPLFTIGRMVKIIVGDEGLELNDIYEWNVGGKNEKAVSRLLEKLRS